MIFFERLEPRLLFDGTVPGVDVTPETLPPDFTPAGSAALVDDWNGDGVNDAGAFLPTGRNRGEFLLDLNADGTLQAEERFVVRGLLNPTVQKMPGDWNGDGNSDAGLYVPTGRNRGVLLLDLDGDCVLQGAERFKLRVPVPAAQSAPGDWTGDGSDDAGTYVATSRSRGVLLLDLDGNHVLEDHERFEIRGVRAPTGRALAGDWNGDGVDDGGVYVPILRSRGILMADLNGNGVLEAGERFDVRGVKDPTVQGISGDWNGNGTEDAGAYIPTSRGGGVLFLDLDGDKDFGADERKSMRRFINPVVGDMNADGIDEIGSYRSGTFRFDTNHDYVLNGRDTTARVANARYKEYFVGDLNSDGQDDVAVRQEGEDWEVHLFDDNDYKGFARNLRRSGTRFFGAFWCPHCASQKALFKDGSRILPYVECSTRDGLGQTAVCALNNVTGYPTWEFPDGTRLAGVQSLNTLAARSGAAIPTARSPFSRTVDFTMEQIV